MFWFIVLLLVAGAGFYFYQKLMTIEREIRAEQQAETARAAAASGETVAPVEKPAIQKAKAQEPPAIVVEEREPTVAETPVPDEAASTEDEILAAVNNLPGIKQTQLYESFPDLEKKQLQQLIKKLADTGVLTREKQGSSYLLYPT